MNLLLDGFGRNGPIFHNPDDLHTPIQNPTFFLYEFSHGQLWRAMGPYSTILTIFTNLIEICVFIQIGSWTAFVCIGLYSTILKTFTKLVNIQYFSLMNLLLDGFGGSIFWRPLQTYSEIQYCSVMNLIPGSFGKSKFHSAPCSLNCLLHRAPFLFIYIYIY